MSLTKEAIIAELKTVFDPEINLDIWTMGLIYDIQIAADNTVQVVMTYTTPLCPFGPLLTAQVKEKILDLGASDVAVTITYEPKWQPSEELRLMLGI